MKLSFIVILEQKRITEFMQCADVFDKSKVIATTKEMELTINDDVKITQGYITKVMDALWAACQQNNYNPIFIHDLSYQVNPLFATDVRSTSNGEKWIMLHTYLKALNLDVQTNDQMYITSVKLKANEG